MELRDIVDKRNLKLKELEDFTANIKTEKRKLNEDENLELIKMKDEVENLNKQIEDIQEADKKATRNDFNQKNNEKNMNNFSLLKTIRDIAENRAASDEAIQIINAGRAAFSKAGITSRGQIVLPLEERDVVLAGTQYAGQEVVAEQKLPLLTGLKARTVLGQAGVQFYTNLVGDVSIPVYSSSSAAWATETGTTANGGGTFSEVTLSPKRLTTYIDISKQFLAQDSINADATLRQDLIDIIAVKIENTFFDATASSTSRPAGLFYDADLTGTLSGTTTFAKLIGMKAAVDTSNALLGSLAYITNPAEAAIMETTTKDSGSGFMVMENGKVGGYPVYVTSNVGTTGGNNLIAFGNWNDAIVGQWSGLDITVDPYTQAIYGKVRLVVNSYWDFKFRRTESYKLNKLS